MQHTPIQPSLLREMTVRRVLTELRRQGPSSRAQLVRHTGISAPTISKAVASLLDAGVLEEGPLDHARVGRPSRSLRLATESAQVLAVVLDGDHLEVSSARLDGASTGCSSRTISRPDSYDGMMDTLVERLQPMIADGPTTFGVGISTPGLIDHAEQTVVLSPNLPITNGRSPARDLQARLGVPCHMVQESHAMCLAERLFSGGQQDAHFVILDATIGLGVGVMEDDRLLLGHRGLAGELGHITMQPDGLRCGCGNTGCLETLATDSALARRIAHQLGEEVSVGRMLDLLRTEPDRFDAELDEAENWLAIALAAAINLFNPAALFVHSQWAALQPTRFERVIERARQRALAPAGEACRIRLSTVTKMQGAIANALDRLFDSPLPAAG